MPEQKFKIVKAQADGYIQAVPAFDSSLAVIESRNFARVLQMHLDRCDCPETAEQIYDILAPVVMGFNNKKLANKLKAS